MQLMSGTVASGVGATCIHFVEAQIRLDGKFWGTRHTATVSAIDTRRRAR
jgi:hypothetical protein